MATNHMKLLSAAHSTLSPVGAIEIIYAKPKKENLDYNTWLLENTLLRWVSPGMVADSSIWNASSACDMGTWTARLVDMADSIKHIFNGDWAQAKPQHYCWKEGGGFCCKSPAETRKKALRAIVSPLEMVSNSGHLPRENAWFKLVQSLKPWAFGSSCHQLFGTIFRHALNVKLDGSDDLVERPDDDFHTIATKRGKKAGVLLAEPNTADKLIA